MRRLGTLVAALCVTALLGCGGSDTTAQTVTVGHTDPLTKAQWIARADAICTKEHKEEAPLKEEFEVARQEPGESPAQLEKLAKLVRELVAMVPEQAAAIRSLEPPTEDREIVQKMLGTIDTAVPLGEEFADAVESGDGEKIEETTQQLEQNAAKSSGLAQGYGLEVCGSGE